MKVHTTHTSGASRPSARGIESQLLAPHPRWPLPWKGLALAGAGLLVLVGLARWSAPSRPVTLIVGIDSSDSVRSNGPDGSLLGRTRIAIAEAASRLAPGYDRLKLVRVDREAREFFDGTAPDGNETLLQLLYDHTQSRAGRTGTLPANFWSFAAQQAESPDLAPGAGVAVVYAGDADNDDLSAASQAQIREAAQRLAANPRVVSVEFYGFNPRNAATLREEFAPLGARFQLQPADAMDTDHVVERLETARASHP